MSTRQPFNPQEAGSVSPRSYSPAPSSTSSSSSSISTTSTHTVVPGTPRAKRSISAMSKMPSRRSSSSSASSSFSDETATPRAAKASLPAPQPNGKSIPRQTPRSASTSAASSTSSFLPSRDHHQGHLQHAHAPTTTRTRSAANLLALVRSTLAPHLTRAKVTTFLILFVLVPLFSFVLRIRRRRRLQLALGAGGAAVAASPAAMAQAATNAALVRRRLQAAGAESGVVQRAWSEVVRVVGDTVRMAGSGLV